MRNSIVVSVRHIGLLVSFFLSTSGAVSISSTDLDTVQISGGGIKGPLAFADVKIFALDPSFPDYYDKTSPLSTTITNQHSEIHGLSFPRRIKPPYILTINGSNGIDLNTGVAPVITTLITVVTDDMLASNRPIFATPLTTLAFHIARLNTEENSYKTNRAKNKAFYKFLSSAASIASSTFAVGQDTNIDLFNAPLVINDYTIDLADQILAVYHRAAVEAFAAKIYTLALSSGITTDTIIRNLALDLHRDGTIDNTDNGKLIRNIDPIFLRQNPMEMLIPNTNYRIKDIMILMREERVLIGTNLGPTFFMDAIAFPEETSSTNSPPINSPSPEVTLSLNSIDFGSLPVGDTSDPLVLTLTNTGTAPLNISDITISSNFSEANNCNNYLPAGENCIFDVQFVPSRTGDITGKLTIVSDAINSSEFASLSGNSTAVDSSNSGNYLLQVDFNNRVLGAYSWADIKTDFQVDMNGYNETNDYYENTSIVPDPADSGRGNVLAVFRKAGRGWSAMGWRGDFKWVEDVYFSYDMYLDPGFEFMKQMKNPGLITGTILQAGHATYDDKPYPEGMLAFNATITSDGQDAWGRGDGAMSTYYYDADVVQRNEFWDMDDPTWDDYANNPTTGGNQYHQPTGRWITVELRIKMNTVTEEGVSGLKDGLQEVWVTDPALWTGAKKVSSHHHRWRITNSMGIDGISMSQGYGGNGNDPGNIPSQDQYHYYDNFRVSTNPITH